MNRRSILWSAVSALSAAFAASRAQARQLVRHGHFHVNGRRVNIPSYQVRPNDVVTVAPSSSAQQVIRDATDLVSTVAPWLQADHDGLTGKVLKQPERGVGCLD